MSRLVDTYRGAVYPWHCDHMGHMNVMWYVGKFDEATWQFFAQIGLTPEFMRRHRRGMTAVYLDTETRKASAFPAAVKERAVAHAIDFKLPWAA